MRVETKNVVGTMAYLIGVKKDVWYDWYGAACPALLEELDNNESAQAIRYLCKIRTSLMRNFKATDQAIIYDYKNLDTLQYYDTVDIKKLQSWGYEVLLFNKRASDYSVHINKLIRENINRCQNLFPDWIKWEYIRELFVYQKCDSDAGNKKEFTKFMENIDCYPFKLYIHWEPKEVGNLLYNDGKFLELLYQSHKDSIGDDSKYKTATTAIKNSIYDFINNSEQTALVVDCENSDVYKLYGMLRSLDQDAIGKIKKIILYDDIHTNDGWDYIERFTNIPVEHVEVERVMDHKSLVDIRMVSGICREFYKNDIDSFIMLSSDSDYCGLFSSLPEANFLVVFEYEKCSYAMKEKLSEDGIHYCSLDDFCTGYIEDFKKAVLKSELKKRLPELLKWNGKELARHIYEQARIKADDNEIMIFYNKYIKTLKLVTDEDGNFSYEMK